MNAEYEKQLKMTYTEQCKYLQEKYGIPKRDYFANEKCKSKVSANSRTSEGLVIHHNAEALPNARNLSHTITALMHPFEYQKKENLTYCNYIEHLILHAKINALGKTEFEYPVEIFEFFNSHGLFLITQDLNNLYNNNGSSLAWLNNCYNVIKDDYDTYARIIKGIITVVVINYNGFRASDYQTVLIGNIVSMCELENGIIYNDLFNIVTKPFNKNDVEVANWIKNSAEDYVFS